MSDLHLLVFSSIIILSTAVYMIIGILAFRKSPGFDPVKSLNLKSGVYQNKTTGEVVEVRGFDDKLAYVTDNTGAWNIRYDVLEANYTFIGAL